MTRDQCEAATIAEGRPCQRIAVEDREVAEIRRVCKVHAKASFVTFAATHNMDKSYFPASRAPDGVTALATNNSGCGWV